MKKLIVFLFSDLFRKGNSYIYNKYKKTLFCIFLIFSCLSFQSCGHTPIYVDQPIQKILKNKSEYSYIKIQLRAFSGRSFYTVWIAPNYAEPTAFSGSHHPVTYNQTFIINKNTSHINYYACFGGSYNKNGSISGPFEPGKTYVYEFYFVQKSFTVNLVETIDSPPSDEELKTL